MKELINMHDEYVDSDSGKVKILSISMTNDPRYPVLGETLHGRERSYTAEGIFNPFGVSRSADLIKVEKPKEKSNMKYVNAGIKTIEEAMRRLESGERLKGKNGAIFGYDISRLLEGRSPYIANHEEIAGVVAIEGSWGSIKEWEKEANWEDDIMAGKPVLCKLSDNGERPHIDHVTEISITQNQPTVYVDSDGDLWMEAEPVKPEETWGYSDERANKERACVDSYLENNLPEE